MNKFLKHLLGLAPASARDITNALDLHLRTLETERAIESGLKVIDKWIYDGCGEATRGVTICPETRFLRLDGTDYRIVIYEDGEVRLYNLKPVLVFKLDRARFNAMKRRFVDTYYVAEKEKL